MVPGLDQHPIHFHPALQPHGQTNSQLRSTGGTEIWGLSSPLGRNCETQEIPVAAKPHAVREGQGGGAYMLVDATG